MFLKETAFLVKTIFILIVLCFISPVMAQTSADSIQADAEEVADTVRVKKKIIVNKTVYVPMAVKTDLFYLSLNGGLFGEESYYNVCESCQEYADKAQATNSSALSYTYGLNAAYAPGKLYFSLGASGSHDRKRFSFVDSKGKAYNANNELKFFGVDFSAGYWFRKNKKGFSYLLMAGASYAWLYQVSGSKLSQDNPDQVVNLNEEMDYYPTVVILNAAFRVLYPISPKTKLFGELYYSYDTRTIIKTDEFVQQRNVYGLRVGIMRTLK